MPTLLVNKEVGTQMWPSIQLSDDLGGVIEHVSVAWPGYPGCRRVPCSPQTSCLLSASQASRWDLGGRNFGCQQAWRCDGRPLCSWACSQSPGLSRCAEPQDTWPWLFSLLVWGSLILTTPQPLLLSGCWPEHPQGEHHISSCVSPSALPSDQRVLGHQEAAGVLAAYYSTILGNGF